MIGKILAALSNPKAGRMLAATLAIAWGLKVLTDTAAEHEAMLEAQEREIEDRQAAIAELGTQAQALAEWLQENAPAHESRHADTHLIAAYGNAEIPDGTTIPKVGTYDKDAGWTE